MRLPWLTCRLSDNVETITQNAPPKRALTVSVFSDYICPFCYIGSVRLQRLREDFDLKVDWIGLEIHPDNPSEGRPLEALGYPAVQWQQMMAALQRMAEEEGLHIAARTFTTNSHKALLLSEASKEDGEEVFYRLHYRLFAAYFGEARNIGDAGVLREVAREAGVSMETIERAWREQRYGQRLQANAVRAARLGVRGTPTFLFGRYLVPGAVPTATLREAATTSLAEGGTPAD
jgi:predicted DsbA family dithiol-disulfide isomerase